MADFDYIPDDLRDKMPSAQEHVEHKLVYRAVSKVELDKFEFYPYIFDSMKYEMNEKFKKKCLSTEEKLRLYAISVFTQLSSLEILRENRSFRERYPFDAYGSTPLYFGIATKDNNKGHVSYFLRDYLNSNPFHIFSVTHIDRNENI